MSSTTWRRLATLLATGTLALTAVSCGEGDTGTDATSSPAATGSGQSASSTAAPNAEAADLAADWLAQQPTDGLVHNAEFDIDDYGLSLDTAMALRTIGGHEETVAQVLDAVAENIDSYTTGADFGTSDVYAGSSAKALAVLAEAGHDPRDIDGVDLLTRVEETAIDDGPATGRVEDLVDPKNESGADYANVIAQAWAARALTLTGSDEAAAVTGYLLQQQCAAGFFVLDLGGDKKAKDQSCDARAPKQEPPVDTTALAVLLLHDLEPAGALADQVDTAVSEASTWLLEQQADDGSFGEAQSGGTNANSTGLAGWALGAVGEDEAAAAAADWVHQRQLHPGGECQLPEAAGAIGYDAAAVRAACKAGKLPGPALDQWRRTTAQAAPVLQWVTEGR